jgi:fructose-1,6-bisphosphatase I
MNQSISAYYATLPHDLRILIDALCIASIDIEHRIRYQLIEDTKGETNESGDVQKPLDVIANDIVTTTLVETRMCNVLVSEENKDPIIVPEVYKGKYMVAFDPLDGSSNIDCNGVIGTIFAIWENEREDTLISGHHIISAGYFMYGPSTEFVITVHNKVDRFVLNSSKEYMYKDTLTMYNKHKKIYSINESNMANWSEEMKQYIDQYKRDNYTARYIGSMVADVHRTLLYGGMFCYPADKKNPNGKLRLLYECYPMAKLIECAGGRAITGHLSNQRILDIDPTHIHQKTPILLGVKEEINTYESVLAKCK